MTNKVTTKSLFSKEDVQQRFEELLGARAQGFISSVLQIANNNSYLQKADPATVLNAAATAAALNLPINPNLGFAWIVPYKGHAQFQMGWKGYVQLAQRTGQYKAINVVCVYENQFKSYNSLTEELDADFIIEPEGEVVGYAAYFSLINGFEKLSYWSKEKVKAHASKYSQTYNKKSSKGRLIHSPWNDADQFDAMAKKTVLKNTLAKWGIMSIEMETAIISDQSVQKKEGQYQYVDNSNTIDIEATDVSKEKERIMLHIEQAGDLDELEMVSELVEEQGLQDEYVERAKQLTDPKGVAA